MAHRTTIIGLIVILCLKSMHSLISLIRLNPTWIINILSYIIYFKLLRSEIHIRSGQNGTRPEKSKCLT